MTKLIEINWHPSPKDLHIFALLVVVAAAAVGGVVYWRNDSISAPACILGGALAVAIVGRSYPVILRYIYTAWMLLALPIGWLVSHLLMAAVYYLVLTPIGVVMRLAGRDPLQRKFDRSAKTYWQPSAAEPDLDRYFLQF